MKKFSANSEASIVNKQAYSKILIAQQLNEA